MSEREVTVVQTGTWLYDGLVEKPVRILCQTWDYYYEEGYQDEPPDLNGEGFAFYAVYGEPRGEPWTPESGRADREVDWFSRSRTCLSLYEATAVAEKAVGSAITWGLLPEIEDLENYIYSLLGQSDWPRPLASAEMLARWEDVVARCEAVYGEAIEVYDNDLFIRDAIAVVLEDPALRRRTEFRWFFGRVPPIDEKFKALLQKDVVIKRDDAPWWRRGVLAYAGPDYAQDIKNLYGIEVEVRGA